jgi:hypothetical protein
VKVIVPVKRVPDTAGEKPLDPETLTVDRDRVEAVLCPMNEYSIEEACRLKEQHDAEVVVLLVGPESAQPVVRKALSYGLDSAGQVTDDAVAGSDALGIAKLIAESVREQELANNPRTCVYCRLETDNPQVDHAIPRARGGNATPPNAQTTCAHCNASKGARDFPVTPPAGYEGPWPPPWWGLSP